MLQLHKLPIFQWLEILHLAQAMLVNWGWVSFPRLLQFCGLTMATYDFQGGCQRKVRILRSFSGPSACRHYHFCSLPRAAMSHHPEWLTWGLKNNSQGCYHVKGASWFWRRAKDSSQRKWVLKLWIPSQPQDCMLLWWFCSGVEIEAHFCPLLEAGMSLTVDQVGFLWDPYVCLDKEKKMKHLGVLFIFEWLRAPGAF